MNKSIFETLQAIFWCLWAVVVITFYFIIILLKLSPYIVFLIVAIWLFNNL